MFEPYQAVILRLPATKPHVIPRKFGPDGFDLVPEVYAWCTALCEDSGFIYSFSMAIVGASTVHDIPALVDPAAWAHIDGRFWFRDRDHALAFKLRWA